MHPKYEFGAARWRKSSYSGGSNGECLEVAEDFPGAALWRKSSYSGGSNGDCLEVAEDFPGIVPVRDSKNIHGPALAFPAEAWVAFISDVKRGGYDGEA
ncbi:DUF397 domain-containing protein [Streptomyces gobiensis]|uniref:DUF397 domain-containing protein n=1 Tax=Streptomyces gobiensis TaxID=2875706 RepID=UPI001E395B5C|nr:DUF397 domain-containing protein [Streptomyces gobiensis]UGY92377.1 DUF397 domain-containing protein [Streptomyces gobiensis]